MPISNGARSDSTASKQSFPGNSGDFMEAVFRDGNFSDFFGGKRPEVAYMSNLKVEFNFRVWHCWKFQMVYRGATLTSDMIEEYKAMIGKVITWLPFISTSKDRQEAELFSTHCLLSIFKNSCLTERI